MHGMHGWRDSKLEGELRLRQAYTNSMQTTGQTLLVLFHDLLSNMLRTKLVQSEVAKHEALDQND